MEISVNNLRDNILKMSSLVEASFSLCFNNEKEIEETFELEKKINEFHILIDDSCFKYIALKAMLQKICVRQLQL